MMLYDVFYKGNACDFDTFLPKPNSEILYARNTNWDGHKLMVQEATDGSLIWAREPGK